MPRQGKASLWKPFQSSSRRFVVSILAMLLLAGSFWLTGFTSEAFNAAGLAGRLAGFVRHTLPPDLSWAFLRHCAATDDCDLSWVYGLG